MDQTRISQTVKWLRLLASSAGGLLNPQARELRFHVLCSAVEGNDEGKEREERKGRKKRWTQRGQQIVFP